MLSKLVVTNYRVFESLTLELKKGLNILVGDNDAGKTTVMEAIQLALTNRLGGQWFNTQLSPFHFNQAAADAYVAGVHAGKNFPPPEILIDLYLTPIDEIASLTGKNNSTLEDVPGLRVRAYFDQNYADEYGKFVPGRGRRHAGPHRVLPRRMARFRREPDHSREVPVDISRIDASAIRLQSGADYYLQQIIARQS